MVWRKKGSVLRYGTERYSTVLYDTEPLAATSGNYQDPAIYRSIIQGIIAIIIYDFLLVQDTKKITCY